MRVPRSTWGRLGLMVLLFAACASPGEPGVLGQWGGTEASLILSRTGGELAYPCGVGTLDPTWTLTADGHLSGFGNHYFGGGPMPSQGRPPQPARYDGQVDRDELTLTVTLTDLNQTLGPYRLVRDGPLVQEMCV